MTPRPVVVVVVGAGLAGLHAAWLLHQRDVPVVVLEARERVGGRTWSHRLGDGTVVERGGEFIAPHQTDIRTLVGRLGLELIPHGFSFDLRPSPGMSAPTPGERAAVMNAARERIAARLGAGEPDFPAEEAFPPPGQRTPVERSVIGRFETSLTVPLRHLSARSLASGEEHGYDPAVRVRGGNQAIALELARRLGRAVRLGTPVAAIEADRAGAVVRCRSGDAVAAAAVVLALPLPLLLELELRPGLPVEVARAAARTCFGDAAKLHVPLAAPRPPAAMASPMGPWWCWTSLQVPALSGFAGGAEAMGALAVADGPARWAELALALWRDAAPAGDALLTHWGAERWTRGSYSCPGVGTTAADDERWTANWGPIVLAGEHTAGPLAGTMNGAVASGARAAETVLEVLR